MNVDEIAFLSELAEAGIEKVFESILTAEDYSKAFTALAVSGAAGMAAALPSCSHQAREQERSAR